MNQLENLNPEEKLARENQDKEAAYKIDYGYFSIEEHTEGWDYNFYDKNMIITDGGIYEDTTISITEAINNILENELFMGKDSLLNRTAPMLNFNEFWEEKDNCEQEQAQSQLKEWKFQQNEDSSYSVYQLKNSDFTDSFRFEGTAHLERNDIDIEKGNFNNVYTGNFNDITKSFTDNEKLNSLWNQFNMERPSDFEGHSLSVGDVVGMKEDGKLTYHFVDSFGFKEIPFENIIEQMHEVDTKAHLTELVGIAKDDVKSLVSVLSSDSFARDELAKAISIASLQDELESDFSFEDVSRLNSYCHDVWLKVDEVSFEKIKDFATSAINENRASIDEIISITRSEFGSAVLDNDTYILSELFPKENNEQLLTPDSDNIKVYGHIGTWYVVDTEKIDGKEYFLLEHEEHGDMAPNIIVDITGHLMLSDVYNGFDDLTDHFDSMIDNPIATLEKSEEQNYNMIDGVMNNMEKADVLENLVQAQADVKAEKEQSKKTVEPKKRPSVLAKLREVKEQSKQNDKQKEKNKDVER